MAAQAVGVLASCAGANRNSYCLLLGSGLRTRGKRCVLGACMLHLLGYRGWRLVEYCDVGCRLVPLGSVTRSRVLAFVLARRGVRCLDGGSVAGL